MPKNIVKYFTLSVLLFFFNFKFQAQERDELWLKERALEISNVNKIERRSIPKKFEVFNLNRDILEEKLKNTPIRSKKSIQSSSFVDFPNDDGTTERFEVFEASILEESLQIKFPRIKSYVGKSIENPEKVVRFSFSEIGLHAMIMQSGRPSIFIDPYTSNRKSYIVYSKQDVPVTDSFECYVDEVSSDQLSKTSFNGAKPNNADDGLLRKFRLAIATTGEYSQFQLVYNGVSSQATTAEKKEVILAAINATMTRVNGIFERDVSLTMELVANNTDIIFLDPDTDGFTNDDGSEIINQSQVIIDANIGFDNYDIGHTFSTGGGGLAELQSPCTSGKARAVTGSSFPIGDSYDVDYVSHEMGHQYGAHHTFNSDKNSCGGGNRNNGTAVEPGSGSTIMAYAGLCAPENIQSRANDYFHVVSIQEMWTNISSGFSTCSSNVETGNTTPTVEDLIAYTIPVSTPFFLSANASDAESDVLTYTWEQLDNEIAPAPPVASSVEGPSFRSVPPSLSSTRYFPNLETVLVGNLINVWEVLPSVSRTMTFGVNVRDNNMNGGQTASKETTITFDESAGPFRITSQNTTESWQSGDEKTITWDVANTNIAPVNCANVTIFLSTDEGETFPYVLAENIENNGTTTIDVPNITTSKGRIKVQSVGNIFYDINNSPIQIQAKEFSMNFDDSDKNVCKPDDVSFSFTYTTFLGFNESTTFSATEVPTGASVNFSPSETSVNNTEVTVTVSGVSNLEFGNYELIIQGVSGDSSMQKVEKLTFNVFQSEIEAPILLSPLNEEIDVIQPYQLNWIADENATQYEVQISTESDFSSIIEENNELISAEFSPQLLVSNTQYFWRVKANNDCGSSSYSNIFSFKTANEVCSSYNATNIPVDIPDNDPDGISSMINVTDNRLISEVEVEINISHSYVSDLAISLISPNGITVLLSASNGRDGDNYTNTVFSDNAEMSITSGTSPFTGTYKPQIPLSYLKGIEGKGNWTLKVVDSEDGDFGSIDNWSIQLCGIPIILENDDDGDGVPNDIDQCPNSTPGTIVDDLGCFMLPSTNFNIEVIGETCPNENNGQIVIESVATYNYSTTVNGVNYNFTNNQLIDNLPSGNYEFCISVADENYEQCFEVTIESGVTIAAKTVSTSKSISVDVSQGTAPFVVLLNGKEVFQTSNSSFSINAGHGDLLQVKTATACEGVFSKSIDLLGEIIAYPNPTDKNVQIALPIQQKEVVIDLYNMQSQLISSKVYIVKSDRVNLNLEHLTTGVYIAKINLEKPIAIKIIKN